MDDESAERLISRLGARFNPWWSGVSALTGVRRDALAVARAELSVDQALAIVGMRQSGKSTLMRQLAEQLIAEGTPPEDILFVNFDEPLLVPHLGDPLALDALTSAYCRVKRPASRPYYFLDEIQNLDHWAGWVRTMVETRAANVVLSGSSSRLIEPALGSALTGRTRRLRFGPLSFRELLRAAGLPAGTEAELAAALQYYLQRGGLPATVHDPDPRAVSRLTQYFEDILSRDIVARHGVRSVPALHEVALHLLEQTGRAFTFQRLKGLFGIGIDQARSYVSYLTEAHLVAVVERYDRRPGARMRAPRKAYARDPGLRNAVVARFSEDLGWLAETVVHNAIAAEWPHRVFYFGGEQTPECDFVLWENTRPVGAIQVCYSAGSIPERERVGLLSAMKQLDLPQGVILTAGKHAEEKVGDRWVRYLPLWRWLIEPGPQMLGTPDHTRIGPG